LPFCQEPKHIARRRRPGVRPSSASQCRRDQHRIVAANNPVDLNQQFRLPTGVASQTPSAMKWWQLIIAARGKALRHRPQQAREQTFQDRRFGPRRPDREPVFGLFLEASYGTFSRNRREKIP
jgi:hypothetical protein